MDAFRLCVAAAPLALYFFYLSWLNFGRRARLSTGAWDLSILGLGLAGVVFVGPMELFVPRDAFLRFGVMLYPLLGLFYCLGLGLVVLLSRPRIVIYNVPAASCRTLLHQVAASLDPDARWAGNCLTLPRLKVELHVEYHLAMRNVSLVATPDDQSYSGWWTLHGAVKSQLKELETSPNTWGVSLLAAALGLAVAIGWQLVKRHDEVAQGVRDLLRL